MEWADENPYFLLLLNDERQNVQIDLGASGWMQAYSEWMRSPGWWYLCHKGSGQIALAMRVWDGEQPYYTKRHIGQIQSADGMNRSAACHGIGKKRLDGHVDRLWILPDGYAVCAGDDVESLAMEVVRSMSWSQPPG